MNNPSIFKLSTVLVFCLALFSCSQANESVLPEPEIKAGIARIYGKLNGSQSKITSLTLSFDNQITADKTFIETTINEDGSFYLEAPIECSTVLGVLNTNGYGAGVVELFADDVVNVELNWGNGGIKVNNLTEHRLLTPRDKENYGNVLTKYSAYSCNSGYSCEPITPDPEKTPAGYARSELDKMKSRTDYAMKGAKLSNAGKELILNEFKLFHLTGKLIPFEKQWEGLSDKKPNTDYYVFLKSFDLNNPKYLYSIFYSLTMQQLLSSQALNIPPIADMPVAGWLKEVKTTLAGLLGFDTGRFYDILAASAYAAQFKVELTPLSDIQKNNIQDYFGDGEIAKILLRKNGEIIRLAEGKSALFVNKTPNDPKEKLMKSIIAKYKGKVIVVDFWATWCGPCLDAMQQYRTVKSELKGKDVVFVYLTNSSSPQELWEEKIKKIGGEHYYLKDEEWEYLMDVFNFKGIPSYVIFDTKGEVRHQFTGYPGNARMRTMIEQLLP